MQVPTSGHSLPGDVFNAYAVVSFSNRIKNWSSLYSYYYTPLPPSFFLFGIAFCYFDSFMKSALKCYWEDMADLCYCFVYVIFSFSLCSLHTTHGRTVKNIQHEYQVSFLLGFMNLVESPILLMILVFPAIQTMMMLDV